MSNSLDPSSSHIIPDLNSNDGKVMLAALISLIVVLSFVLLLHVYARWFLAQPQHYHHRRRRRRRGITQSGPQSNVPAITHLQNQNLHAFVYHGEDAHTGFGADGLDVSAIASLPLFMYMSDVHKDGLECAICLSVFEDEEVGRLLPKCQHSFHVECIDMWLQSRSNCPICRTPVASSEALKEVEVSVSVNNNPVELQDYSSGNISNIVAESAGTEQVHESCPLEVQIEMPNDSNFECEVHKQSLTAAATTSPQHQIVCSLKRMLSMNRSEHRVIPSSSVTSS